MVMDKLTKSQAVVISGYTMILICDFSDLHRDIEKRLERPVLTSELPSISEEIKEAYRQDFLSMHP